MQSYETELQSTFIFKNTKRVAPIEATLNQNLDVIDNDDLSIINNFLVYNGIAIGHSNYV